MPRVDNYEQDYLVQTTKGMVTIEEAVCFGPFNSIRRVLEFADFEVGPDDLEFIRFPLVPHESLSDDMVKCWVDFMLSFGFKEAILGVDLEKGYMDFDIHKVPQQETFLGITTARSLGEQPDAVSFFYYATQRGMKPIDAFLVCYSMVEVKDKVYEFGHLNGRDIHVPLIPRQLTYWAVNNFAKYPIPHRELVEGRSHTKPYKQYQSYSQLQNFIHGTASEEDKGTPPIMYLKGTTFNFTKESTTKLLTQLSEKLYERAKSQPEKDTGLRRYAIR